MPRGTSRQVKPRPKHSKAKKQHAHKSRQARLGGTRSQRLHAARTPLPHLQPPCPCPCPQPILPVQPVQAQIGEASPPTPIGQPSAGAGGANVTVIQSHPIGGTATGVQSWSR